MINEGQGKTQEAPEERETTWSSRAAIFSGFLIKLSKVDQIPSASQGSDLMSGIVWYPVVHPRTSFRISDLRWHRCLKEELRPFSGSGGEHISDLKY